MMLGPEKALFAIPMTWALISLTMIDFDTQLLPDAITLPLLWAGLLVNSGRYVCAA
jgi:leader peptidase (prepilin peptidase)/N-methyltransferase